MHTLTDLFVSAQGWLFDSFVQPLLFGLGLGGFVEMGFEGIEFVLLGLIELAIAYTLMRPLEAWWPAERWAQRRAVRVDVIYTVLNRLGIVPLAGVVVNPAAILLGSVLVLAGALWHEVITHCRAVQKEAVP